MHGASSSPPPHFGSPHIQQRTLSLACPGPRVVDEVQEVQPGVATAVEPGLTGAAGVSGSTIDLGGSHLERYAHAFEEGTCLKSVSPIPAVLGQRHKGAQTEEQETADDGQESRRNRVESAGG